MQLYYKIAAVLFIIWLLFLISRRIWEYFFPKALPADAVLPDSKFIQVGEFNIRYVQRGSKNSPNVLLIHGLCASIYSWRMIIDDLAKDFFVTAFDLPGFGLSDKHPECSYGLDAQTERVFALMDTLNISDFNLIGHSLGGGLAAWMAKVHPKRIHKLCLIGPAINQRFLPITPDSWLWGFHLVKKFVITPRVIKRVYKHVSYRHNPPDIAEIIYNYYRPYHNSPNAAVAFFKSIELVRDQRLVSSVSNLISPTLVLYADHDRVIKKKRIEKYLNANPQVKGVLIRSCGHMLAEEKPDIILQNIREFFDDIKK